MRDVNILFQFDTKLAEMKEKLSDIKIIADRDREHLKKDEHLYAEFSSQFIDISTGVDNHEIFGVQREYQLAIEKKKQMQFQSIP